MESAEPDSIEGCPGCSASGPPWSGGIRRPGRPGPYGTLDGPKAVCCTPRTTVMTGKGPAVNGDRPELPKEVDRLTARMQSLDARMESMVDTDGVLLPGISESEWQRVNTELDAVLVRLLPLIRAAEERAQVKRINGLLRHHDGRGGRRNDGGACSELRNKLGLNRITTPPAPSPSTAPFYRRQSLHANHIELDQRFLCWSSAGPGTCTRIVSGMWAPAAEPSVDVAAGGKRPSRSQDRWAPLGSSGDDPEKFPVRLV